MNLSSNILVGCFIRTNNQPDTLIALRYLQHLNTLLYVGITVVTCTLIQKNTCRLHIAMYLFGDKSSMTLKCGIAECH